MTIRGKRGNRNSETAKVEIYTPTKIGYLLLVCARNNMRLADHISDPHENLVKIGNELRT